MKMIKTTIICVLFIIGILLLFGECESVYDTLLIKFFAIVDMIIITYLWQWWKMGEDDKIKKYIEEDD